MQIDMFCVFSFLNLIGFRGVFVEVTFSKTPEFLKSFFSRILGVEDIVRLIGCQTFSFRIRMIRPRDWDEGERRLMLRGIHGNVGNPNNLNAFKFLCPHVTNWISFGIRSRPQEIQTI